MLLCANYLCLMFCGYIFEVGAVIEPSARLSSSHSEQAIILGSPVHVQLGIDGSPTQIGIIELCIGFKKNYDYNTFETSPLNDALRCESDLSWWNGSTLVLLILL